MHALMFNRKLWSIFLGDALSEGNPQPLEVRQNIVDISIFVMTHTLEMQNHPQIHESEFADRHQSQYRGRPVRTRLI